MPQGPNTQPEGPRKYLRGALSLFVTAGLVVVLFIWLPAYRWFFLGSLAIGVIVAAILFFWNHYRPLKEEDVENKRPLGLE